MSRRFSSLLAAFAVILLLSLAGVAVAALVVVDAEKAKITASRPDRDAVEGLWSVYQNWDPMPKQAQRYRIAIVRNNHGIFKEAKYLGVVLCDKEGCTKGEVKLLLTPTGKKNEFQATWRTGKGDAKGIVRLEADEKGVSDAVIDLNALKIQGHIIVKWLVRIPENK